MMKKLIALLMVLVLLTGMWPMAMAAEETKIFVDSTGREVIVPAKIDRIAVSGSMAQIIVFALAPDMLVGTSSPWEPTELAYIPEKYAQLPALGQLYGGKGDLNLEELLMADPQVVIDVGEAKGSIREDMDDLTQQTGIPFVHIDAYLENMSDAYEMMGELLDMEAEAAVLAAYCRETYERTVAISQQVEKKSLLFVTGDEAQNVIARDSYHSAVIDLLSENAAVVESPSSKGLGNEVSMEQLLMWDPECIVFSAVGVFDQVAEDPSWQAMQAIASNAYYEVPTGPYNWMGFPSSVQRLLGMTWMAKLLYPDAADYDLYTETARHFELFYHYDLTQEQYDALVANSIGKLGE